MADQTLNMKKTLENFDELYKLAQLMEYKLPEPPASIRKALERNINKFGSKYAAKFSKIILKSINSGKIEEALLVVVPVGIVWVGAGAIDFVNSKKAENAQKKAQSELNALYKEIAVKANEIILQLAADSKQLEQLLLDEKQRNVDNQAQIAKLRQRIDKGQEIICRFANLQKNM